MIKSNLLYLIFFLTVLFSQSCKRGDPCSGMDLSDKVFRNNIPDSNKTKIPYTGRDTLILVSDGGDTATFIGQGKNDYFETTRTLANGGGDCSKFDVRNYENLNLSFNKNNQTTFTIKLSYYLNQKLVYPSLTNISFCVNNQLIANSSCEYLDFKKSEQNDSILYANKYYGGVFLDDTKTVLFNSQIGLIKFKDLANRVWTLILKK